MAHSIARLTWILAGSLFIFGLALAEPVVVERDSSLHAEPRADAAVTASVKKGTAGDATTRKGPWVNLKTSAGAGWILSFNLRYGAGAAGGAGGDAAALGKIAGSRQKLAVTSTIGIRGIESEDLKQAQFNEQQISLLEKLRSTDAQAKASASANGLHTVTVDYLDKR